MNRETTNHIRFVIEDCLPPLVRDSSLFAALATLVFGKQIADIAEFRRRAVELTPAEYETQYRVTPRIHSTTDNSRACIEKIVSDIVGESICDVGCGTGYLLKAAIEARRSALTRCVGVEFVEPSEKDTSFEFVKAAIEHLPFADAEFDTVVCTHVIEHILNYRQAISELRRIARRRLIIVVPREREGIYSFNLHLNFFPYKHSFLRAMIPMPKNYFCSDIGRDIYYYEDMIEGNDR
jgi:SAM-dependent methyltransferase